MNKSSRDEVNNCEKRARHENILSSDECCAIQGAVLDVYKEMGCGYLEAVYQECLEKEFSIRSIPFKAQTEPQLAYRSEPLKQVYKPDFICHDKIIAELKAVKGIALEHKAQLLNYLKTTSLELGLLVKFGSIPKLKSHDHKHQLSRFSRSSRFKIIGNTGHCSCF